MNCLTVAQVTAAQEIVHGPVTCELANRFISRTASEANCEWAQLTGLQRTDLQDPKGSAWRLRDLQKTLCSKIRIGHSRRDRQLRLRRRFGRLQTKPASRCKSEYPSDRFKCIRCAWGKLLLHGGWARFRSSSRRNHRLLQQSCEENRTRRSAKVCTAFTVPGNGVIARARTARTTSISTAGRLSSGGTNGTGSGPAHCHPVHERHGDREAAGVPFSVGRCLQGLGKCRRPQQFLLQDARQIGPSCPRRGL